MKSKIKNLELKIESLWKKPCKNASDAHFKSLELTRLQNKLINSKQNENNRNS